MPSDELLRYVVEARTRGLSELQIKAALINAGWKMDDIDAALETGVSSPGFLLPPLSLLLLPPLANHPSSLL